MANEDLLERANAQADILHDCGFELSAKLMRELAAEVRELRKDKARLEWVLANCMFKRRIDPMLPDWAEGDRHWIDKQIVAAMGATEND